jgi:TonB family protein
MQEPGGLQQMAAVSMLAHGALLAALIVAPAGLFGRQADAPRIVMSISLGGGVPGPDNGGLTSIGGRPVQEVQPPEAPREAVRAPAAKAPAMTLPDQSARSSKAGANVAQAPDDARGRTPTKGAETTPGSSVAATGVRGQGFGLSTGGGTGINVGLDVNDFCCPDYLLTLVQRIRNGWDQKTENTGEVVVTFTIERNGTITQPHVERSSSIFTLDQNALRAVVGTKQLAPLPDAYTNPRLTLHLTFQYTR